MLGVPAALADAGAYDCIEAPEVAAIEDDQPGVQPLPSIQDGPLVSYDTIEGGIEGAMWEAALQGIEAMPTGAEIGAGDDPGAGSAGTGTDDDGLAPKAVVADVPKPAPKPTGLVEPATGVGKNRNKRFINGEWVRNYKGTGRPPEFNKFEWQAIPHAARKIFLANMAELAARREDAGVDRPGSSALDAALPVAAAAAAGVRPTGHRRRAVTHVAPDS